MKGAVYWGQINNAANINHPLKKNPITVRGLLPALGPEDSVLIQLKVETNSVVSKIAGITVEKLRLAQE